MSPTDCCDETSRLKIARRFGSAMISKTDSILCIYAITYIRVKAYLNGTRKKGSTCSGHCLSVTNCTNRLTRDALVAIARVLSGVRSNEKDSTREVCNRDECATGKRKF